MREEKGKEKNVKMGHQKLTVDDVKGTTSNQKTNDTKYRSVNGDKTGHENVTHSDPVHRFVAEDGITPRRSRQLGAQQRIGSEADRSPLMLSQRDSLSTNGGAKPGEKGRPDGRRTKDCEASVGRFPNLTMGDPLDHATGLEKREMLAKLSGNTNPFDLRMIKRGPGTKDEPTEIPSAFGSRIIGCICHHDATAIFYMWLHNGHPKRCECGHWFKLVYKAPV
ncbi:hypothetical protein FQR65_LT11944 [Abscondita terminalis]|nr:hypothetical protein FQR65_LT11944 [Abscondita terminalis]